MYKDDVIKMFRKGYHLKGDAIPIVAAKKGREIISDVSGMRFVSHVGLSICTPFKITTILLYSHRSNTRRDIASRWVTISVP